MWGRWGERAKGKGLTEGEVEDELEAEGRKEKRIEHGELSHYRSPAGSRRRLAAAAGRLAGAAAGKLHRPPRGTTG